MTLLRSEIPSGTRAKLRTVAATIEIMLAISLTVACSLYTYDGVILHAHPVRGESHNERNTTGEVATTSPPFYNEPHRSHVLCVKAERCTTFTSWSQHHFVAIGNPERHARKASHRGSKQQQRSCSQSLLLLVARATHMMVLFFTHILFVVNHTINATPPERLQQPPNFLSYLVILCFEGRDPKQNTVARLKLQFLPSPIILCGLRQSTK